MGPTSTVVMDASAGQHGIVFNLGASQRRAVGSDNDQLDYTDREMRCLDSNTLSLAQRLQGRLVAQAVLATFHDQGQAGVDRFGRLLLLQKHTQEDQEGMSYSSLLGNSHRGVEVV